MGLLLFAIFSFSGKGSHHQQAIDDQWYYGHSVKQDWPVHLLRSLGPSFCALGFWVFLWSFSAYFAFVFCFATQLRSTIVCRCLSSLQVYRQDLQRQKEATEKAEEFFFANLRSYAFAKRTASSYPADAGHFTLLMMTTNGRTSRRCPKSVSA